MKILIRKRLHNYLRTAFFSLRDAESNRATILEGVVQSKWPNKNPSLCHWKQARGIIGIFRTFHSACKPERKDPVEQITKTKKINLPEWLALLQSVTHKLRTLQDAELLESSFETELNQLQSIPSEKMAEDVWTLFPIISTREILHANPGLQIEVIKLAVFSGYMNDSFYNKSIQTVVDKIRDSILTTSMMTNFFEVLGVGTLRGVLTSTREVTLLLLTMVAAHCKSFGAGSLIRIVKVMGSLNMRDQEAQTVLRTLMSRLVDTDPAIPQLRSGYDMATVVYAMAKCRAEHKVLLNQVAEKIKMNPKILDGTSPGGITSLLYGFAKFYHKDVLLYSLISRVCRVRLVEFPVSLLPQLVASFHRSGLRSSVLLSRISAVLKRANFESDFSYVTGQDVVNLALGFSSHQCRDEALFSIFSRLLRDKQKVGGMEGSNGCNRLQGLSVPDLIHIFRAWAKAKVEDYTLLQAASRCISEKIESSREEVNAELAIAYITHCSKLNYRDISVVSRMLEYSIKPSLENLQPDDVLLLSASLRDLGISDCLVTSTVDEAFQNKVRANNEIFCRRVRASVGTRPSVESNPVKQVRMESEEKCTDKEAYMVRQHVLLCPCTWGWRDNFEGFKFFNLKKGRTVNLHL